MTPSSRIFSPLAASVAPGRRDVDDEIGSAGRRRSFGGAQALDDAVVGEAFAGQEAPRQIEVFGRHADGAPVLAPEHRRGGLEVRHLADVEPAARHRNNNVGAAEAELLHQCHALVGVGDVLAHEIFARDADVRASR